MRSRSAAGVALSMVLLAVGAHAGPASGATDSPTGACQAHLVDTDPSDSSSTHFEGAITAGVVWSRSTIGTPTTTSSSVQCVVQASPVPGGGAVIEACSFSGPTPYTVLGGCDLSVDLAPSASAYVCTTYSWSEGPANYGYTTSSCPLVRAAPATSGAEDEPLGGCNFAALGDPASQNVRFTGEMDAEVVFTSRSPGSLPVTTASSVTCTLQASGSYGGGGSLASCPFSGPDATVIVGTCVMSYDHPSGELFFCTTYTWVEPSGVYTMNLDFDPATPGEQCAVVVSS